MATEDMNSPAMSVLVRAVAGEVASLLRLEFARLTPSEVQPVLLNVKQAAVYLGRTEQSVQHLIFQRDLPVVRMGERFIYITGTCDAWNEETALDEMRQRVEPLLAKRSSDPRWTVKKKEFLDKLPGILAALSKPKLPTAKELSDVIAERDGYKELNDESKAELLDCQLVLNNYVGHRTSIVATG
jgi:hypothetical protein